MKFQNYTREQIAQACRAYGPLLRLENAPGVDGPTLLWALSGRESSFGANCKPRFEPAYYTGGRYAAADSQKALIAEFGQDAAYSYGPWQVMLCNAPGFTPDELGMDLEKAAVATVGFINRRILIAEHATTVDQVADAYNSGNWRDNIHPVDYCLAVGKFYRAGLPALAQAATGGVLHP